MKNITSKIDSIIVELDLSNYSDNMLKTLAEQQAISELEFQAEKQRREANLF